MVMSSHQISSMIGGQQVLFANQAIYGQQISSQYFGGPAPQPMHNPFPAPVNYGVTASAQNLGASVAGGIGQAIPGVAAGASMMAGLAGGPLGALDPFTTVPKAFAGGAGALGQGFGGTMGAIGKSFASRGALGGLGAIGGGLVAGAAAALPYYGAAKAIGYVGESMYQGAQDIAQVGAITERMGPFYGEGGGRQGGKLPRRQIQAITGMLNEITSQEASLASKEVMDLFDKAERHGLFADVSNPRQIQDKFKKMVKQVTTIAKVMGSTIDEAMPLMGEMQRMGMWRPEDVMGTASAARMVGKQNVPALMQTMQQGAQGSWQRGGTLAAGATLGRENLLGVQAAMGAGVFSSEQLRELTGGVGGMQGQQMVAGQLTSMMQGMQDTSMGRLTMAALGEKKDGAFTGQIDPELMRRFQAGGFTVGELQRMGEKKTKGQEAAVSFEQRRGRIGQQMAAQGGISGISQMVESVTEAAGYGGAGESIQQRFIQQITGVDERWAEAFQILKQGLPAMQDFHRQKAQASAQSSLRGLDIKMNRSMEGIKKAIGNLMFKSFERPMKEIGGELATRMGQITDEAQAMVFGSLEKTFLGGGAGGGEHIRMQTPRMEQWRRSEGIFHTAASALLGHGEGTRGQTAMGLMGPAGLQRYIESGEEIAEGEVELATYGGRKVVSRESDVQMMARKTEQWSKAETSLKDLGFQKDAEDSQDWATVKKEVDKLLSGRGNLSFEELRTLEGKSKGRPGQYINLLMRKGNLGEEGWQALKRLGAKGEGKQGMGMVDAFVMASKEATYTRYAPDTEKMSGRWAEMRVGHEPATLRKEVIESREELTSALQDEVSEQAGLGGFIAKAFGEVAAVLPAGITAVLPSGLGVAASLVARQPIVGMVGRELAGFVSGIIGLGPDISDKDVADAVANEKWGPIFSDWLAKGSPSNHAFIKVANEDPTAGKMHDAVITANKDPETAAALKTVGGKHDEGITKLKAATKWKQTKGWAEAALGRLSEVPVKALGGALREKYRSTLEAYGGDDKVEAASRMEELVEMAQESPRAAKQLAALGAIGGYAGGRGMAGQLTEGVMGTWSVGKYKGLMGRIGGASGFDITAKLSEEQREKIKGWEKSDGGLDFGERMRIQRMVEQVQEKEGITAGKGKSTAEQQLTTLMGGLSENVKNNITALQANTMAIKGDDKKPQGEDLAGAVQAEKK